MNISRLKEVPLRDLWPNEAYDFTIWLSDNMDMLSEALGFELSLIETEAKAGAFSSDIFAEDERGNPVVIENQLEKTNHDHLGKLIAYMSNLNAKIAVWITPEPRIEHEKAVQWLNEFLPADVAFYLVRIQAYRIEDSASAPLFTIIAGPSEEARQAGEQKKELAERHINRKEFWSQLLEAANRRTKLHAQRSPTIDTWLNAGAGRSGLAFQYRIRMDDAQVGLRIRCATIEDSKKVFDALYAKRSEVEQKFGKPLEWLRQDDIKTSVIQHVIPGGGLKNEGQWKEIQDRMIDAMLRLETALSPEIARL